MIGTDWSGMKPPDRYLTPVRPEYEVVETRERSPGRAPTTYNVDVHICNWRGGRVVEGARLLSE